MTTVADEINLTDYEQAIEGHAKLKSNFRFTNSGSAHARIVMTNIFKTAEKKVNIFACDLNGAVSHGSYITSLRDYLKRGGILNVILEKNNEQSEALELLKKMKKEGNKNISISLLNSSEIAKVYIDGKTYHFTVADDRMYRFETDTTNYKAVLNFNDPVLSESLNKVFQGFEKLATPLAD